MEDEEIWVGVDTSIVPVYIRESALMSGVNNHQWGMANSIPAAMDLPFTHAR